MKNKYSYKYKKKIADRINKIKNKKDFVKIFEIIQSDKSDKKNQITENNNGLFLLFHNLKDETYVEIEKYLKILNKKRRYYKDSVNSEDIASNTDLYKPYAIDEFPSQKGISPKLKYSNKEKNIIKKKRYEMNINSENNDDVIYCKFDVENLTETETAT